MNKYFNFSKKVFDFALNDLKQRYAGSRLGMIWAYIQTIAMVLVYWIVFEFGLKVGGIEGIPFLPWFIAGMMPWLFFSDCLNTSLGCMYDYGYVVKKMLFNLNIIPASKILVSFFIHFFLSVVVVCVAIFNDIFTGIFLFQLIYYFFALIMLIIPLVYLGSVVCVFFKDFQQVIAILLNFGMWATPIVWDFSIVPISLQWIFKLNPIFYIVDGFRNSIIYGQSMFYDITYTFYYWGIVFILWIFCIPAYKRLLPHIADIL